MARDELLTSPFTVIIDSREQHPYRFTDLRADARQGHRPLLVQTRVCYLRSGDYSLAGCEEQIAVERKSLADLFGTLSQGRDRFTRELERLDRLAYAAVIVEATWEQVLLAPPPFSRLCPKTVHRSVIAWSQRYPRVHWWLVGDRRLGEITTYRILERYWRDQCARTAEGT